MIRPTFRSPTVLSVLACALAALPVACAGIEETPNTSPDAPIDSTRSALVDFNPCHPDWQLPTSARLESYSTDDPTFNDFEDILERGGSRWVGTYDKETPRRSIVRVDTFEHFTKTDPHSALWFMAVIPAQSKEALKAIDTYRDLPPVSSRLAGFCTNDQVFYAYDGALPAIGVSQYVVEYDPRCTCSESPSAELQVHVSTPIYSSMPAPRY